MKLLIQFPLRLPSVANLREHWSAKAKRAKAHRAAVRITAGHQYAGMAAPFVVTLTRISPRKLDDDNLASAFKAIRDQVAAELRIDDGDSRIAWLYRQEKGANAVRIEVEEVSPGVLGWRLNDERPKDGHNQPKRAKTRHKPAWAWVPCIVCGHDRDGCGHWTGHGAL